MNKILRKPDNAPDEAQALIRLRFAKCWMWFDSSGNPVLKEVSFFNGILLKLSTLVDILFPSVGFPITVLEIYDKTFDLELDFFEKYDE